MKAKNACWIGNKSSIDTLIINYKNIYYPPVGILMWIIVFLELVIFGMAIVAFVCYGKQELEVFYQSRLQLNTTLGVLNTIFFIDQRFVYGSWISGIQGK